tara:strand:+ start:28 stop:960 length:933 start_codon:yes stop_codon:yes gene_type:complete
LQSKLNNAKKLRAPGNRTPLRNKMLKKISYIFYKIFKIIDKIFQITLRRNIIGWIKHFIHEDSYKDKIILDKKVKFFIPNQITEWRVNNLFEKEPETIDWINTFSNKEKIVFWDIGANIGIYSIYAAIKHPRCDVVSFEPSTSNLRVLSRNISINNLENKIKIFSNPLSNKNNKFLTMKESRFQEGSSFNNFGENFDFEGKEFKSKMNYQLVGNTIDYLINNQILSLPNYIKIDVDGIEHLILDGGKDCLINENVKSISVELNENFKDQFEAVMSIMKKCNFHISSKKHNDAYYEKEEFQKTYNYVFVKR